MRCVSGTTASEARMVKAIQKAVGVVQDNSIGPSTITSIAAKLGAECWPLSISIYGQPTIIAKDVVPLSVKSPLLRFSNAISGGFNNGGGPCSMLVANGVGVWTISCHYIDDKTPESVLFRRKDGTLGLARVRNISELGGVNGVRWAIGGMGLLGNYNPAAEGFKGRFSDVLRKTNHTMIGVKDGLIYMVYCANMTAAQVNNHAKKLGLEKAIMLDGGHLAAINGEEAFAKINTAQRQMYVIQAR